MDAFYIVITTMRSYSVALTMLLKSIPASIKYIIVYSKEESNEIKIKEDGNIEVSIKNNIYEYGAYIGVNMLLEKILIPKKTVFLFIHDTCKFGPEAPIKIPPLIKDFRNVPQDIFWLSRGGLSNICLIKPEAVKEGAKIYKNYQVMDKMMAIDGEHNRNSISPKNLPVSHMMTTIPVEQRGINFVYNNQVKRTVIYYSLIDLEKNYVYINKTSEHPQKP